MHSLHTRPSRIQHTTWTTNRQHHTPYEYQPKILGLTLDPKLTYNNHIEITTTKARKTIQIIKALTSTTWGKQKETIIATYKAITRPILEYVSTIWSPLASDTNINKLQITQNTALKIATGCTTDTNTQRLHDETHTLPIREHLQLHASQIRQKSQHPTPHPLHHNTTPRRKKQTTYNNTDYTTNIDTNPNTIDDAKIKTNMKHIHTTIVSTYLNNRQHNKVTNTIPLTVHHSKTTVPRATRRTLAQLRTNKCPLLRSYLNKIDEYKHPSPLCPLCKTEPHTTLLLINCTNINTQLQVTD